MDKVFTEELIQSMTTNIDPSRTIAYKKETDTLFLDDSKIRTVESAINNSPEQSETFGSQIIRQSGNNISVMKRSMARMPSFHLDEPSTVQTARISDYDVARWGGFVTDILDNKVLVKLHDLERDDSYYEVGELPISRVSKDDLPLVAKGAAFYLSVGYFRKSNGEINKGVLLKFRRSNLWSEEEYNSAADRADSMVQKIRFEDVE